MSLVSVGESQAFAAEDTVFLITPGRSDNKIALDFPISEMRVLEAVSGRQMGICVPDRHLVLLGPAETSFTGAIRWPFSGTATTTTLGTGLGQKPGSFSYPLSFDAGPDGRMFVLDAGNQRIQAFDADGQYITHWGSLGADDGQFDFGEGQRPEDFWGSLIVDGVGFIYVADVGNKRIQKFAP
jgi:hypothetical protein